jgi:hypothetical protein
MCISGLLGYYWPGWLMQSFFIGFISVFFTYPFFQWLKVFVFNPEEAFKVRIQFQKRFLFVGIVNYNKTEKLYDNFVSIKAYLIIALPWIVITQFFLGPPFIFSTACIVIFSAACARDFSAKLVDYVP